VPPVGRASAVVAVAAALGVIGAHAQDSPSFRSRIVVVNVTATVTGGDGRFVSGLTRNDFSIFEDGRQRELVSFVDEAAPVSLGILFDASGSMAGRKVELARQTVSRFVQHDFDAMSEWFFGRFGYSLAVVQEWTSDRDAIVQPLREVRATGDTTLYDTVALAIPLVNEGRFAKKALLVVSDGGESKSVLSLDEVERAIGAEDVRVLAIGIDAPGAPRDDRLHLDVLRRIADDTGGSTYAVADSAAIHVVTARIADELRHEYLLGYSTASIDGRRHSIRVDVRGRRSKVRARRGFLAN
jgi:Ca-activated chloride channel family protein